MSLHSFKIILLVALFAALCIKGGQICSAGGVMAMTRLVEPATIVPVDPMPMHSVEDDFRGVSPRPDLSTRLMPAKRVIKNQAKIPVRKSASGHAPSSESAKKTAKKS